MSPAGLQPAGAARGQPTLTLPELDQRLRQFIVETYHQRAHSATGVPPQMRWEDSGFLPRLPDSIEQLDLLLLTVAKPRRVHQDGIHFQGFRYLDTTLAAYIGEDVIIRYDPRDMAELRVYFHDEFVCRAINPELAGETVALKDSCVPGTSVGESCARHWPSGKPRSKRCWAYVAVSNRSYRLPNPNRQTRRRNRHARD